MSDDDDFMQDSDQEDYDFEYEDNDDEEDADVDIENKYYNAKQMKSTDPEAAIEEFLEIPALEQEKRLLSIIANFLTYVKSAVTRNYSEKSINNILDFIEKGSEGDAARKCMEEFYSNTLQSFQSTNNERLWLKTNIKLAKLCLDRKDYAATTKKLKELRKACELEDGTDDPSKGTYSLEIYACEIQMHSETKNNKQLKRLYERALKVKSAVPHPRIMGIIRECGGKMHMNEENWKDAQSDFFQSFKDYDEAGSLQRIQVLKYLVLTTMLMKSDINPFESQETKPYKNDPRIAAMTDLVDAYQRDDIHKYEAVLKSNKDLMADSFIRENIDEKSKISWVFLIIDKKVNGKINQQDGTVEIEDNSDAERLKAMREWTTAIGSLYETIFKESEGFRNNDVNLIGDVDKDSGLGGYVPGGDKGLLRYGGQKGGKHPMTGRPLKKLF
ncbi:hypothetical protein DID88_007488 [Monilinia fructigena]|uniref:COP9 signalosome complex subunit 2 n=1 Tax=Monilinia fructigena TaxID=38457 RepID=A0A395J3M7_9HELO|nr:hypothetical protein DID88_007488 [Monilinia fructigena]